MGKKFKNWGKLGENCIFGDFSIFVEEIFTTLWWQTTFALKWVSKLKNFNLGDIFGEFLPILGQFLDFFGLGGFHIDPHIVTNNFCFHVMAQKWVSRLRITFLGGFWGNFCQFWGNFWIFFAWGLPYWPPYCYKRLLLSWYGPEMSIKTENYIFRGNLGQFLPIFGKIFGFFLLGGLPYWPPYCYIQLLLSWYGPEMAIKASSFYLLPSLFWTLQTGLGKPGQAEIEKFRFSPLTNTHTKTGSICGEMRKHFLNFGA